MSFQTQLTWLITSVARCYEINGLTQLNMPPIGFNYKSPLTNGARASVDFRRIDSCQRTTYYIHRLNVEPVVIAILTGSE